MRQVLAHPDRTLADDLDTTEAELLDRRRPFLDFLQDQWRLGRQWGAANILITHAIADLQAQAGAGTATARIAEGLLNTTSVRVFLHQNPEQTGHLLTGLGLTSVETDLLRALPPFTALWDVGGHTALVDHIITDDEWTFADTDSAMRPQDAS